MASAASILASGSSIATGINALAGLIVVSPQSTIGYQPQPFALSTNLNKTALPNFVFNYEGEQTVSLQSDITDHYVENNSPIQDQIAIKPEIITTQGFIGELNDISPPALRALQIAAQKLTNISGYVPSLSATALIAYNEALFAYQTASNAIDSAVSAVSSIGNFIDDVDAAQTFVGSNGLIRSTTPQNKQQTAFQQFYGYWYKRSLFSIQTPWCVFTDMAIQSLRAVQDAETETITTFEITFKHLRFAESNLSSDNSDAQGRLVTQKQSVVPGGNSSGGASVPFPIGAAQ